MYARYKKINAKGFSYLEILIAMIVMSVALVPIVQALSTPWVTSSEEDYLILNASRDKMEEILSMAFADIVVETPSIAFDDTVLIGGVNIPIDVTVALYNIDGTPGTESDVKKITVDVDKVLLEVLKVGP